MCVIFSFFGNVDLSPADAPFAEVLFGTVHKLDEVPAVMQDTSRDVGDDPLSVLRELRQRTRQLRGIRRRALLAVHVDVDLDLARCA